MKKGLFSVRIVFTLWAQVLLKLRLSIKEVHKRLSDQSFVRVGSCIWATLNIGASSYLVGVEGREITKNAGIFIFGEGIRLYKSIWLRKQRPRKSCDPQTCPGTSQGGESSEEFQVVLSPLRYQKAQAYQDQKHWKFQDLQSECWQQVCIMGPPPPPLNILVGSSDDGHGWILCQCFHH